MNCFPSVKNEGRSLVYDMLPVPLNNVPFHNNTDAITRYFTAEFPLHLAVHAVSPVSEPPEEYTLPHVHEECDEVNIIISQGDLLYRIRLGAEEFTVSNNSCIWIPRGMIHSANVLQGEGFFITLRMA